MQDENNNLNNYTHIPTSELERDIAITKKEIKNYEDMNKIYMRNPPENKTSIYLNEGRIAQRKDLIERIQEIIDFRKVQDGN